MVSGKSALTNEKERKQILQKADKYSALTDMYSTMIGQNIAEMFVNLREA